MSSLTNISDNELMTKSRNELLTICVRQNKIIREMNAQKEKTGELIRLNYEQFMELRAQIYSMISEARQHSPLKVTWRKDKDV